MKNTASENTRRYTNQIIGSDVVTVDLLFKILENGFYFGISEHDEICAQHFSDSAKYLCRFTRNKVANESYDLEEVEKEITVNKQIFDRLTTLFPYCCNLLNLRDDSHLLWLLNDIVELACEYWPNHSKPRKDLEKRQKLENLTSLYQAADSLKTAFQVVKADIGEVLQSPLHNGLGSNFKLSKTQQSDLNLTMETYLIDIQYKIDWIQFDETTIWLTGNNYKTRIVESAYAIARQNDLKYSTASGSDFQILCSVIYEITTGIADEGLMGAIKKFSNSRTRKEEDDYLEEEAESLREFDDNFSGIRRECRSIAKKILKHTAFVGFGGATELSRAIALDHAYDLHLYLLETRKRIGPFIVWADQAPDGYFDKPLEDGEYRKQALDARDGKLKPNPDKNYTLEKFLDMEADARVNLNL